MLRALLVCASVLLIFGESFSQPLFECNRVNERKIQRQALIASIAKCATQMRFDTEWVRVWVLLLNR